MDWNVEIVQELIKLKKAGYAMCFFFSLSIIYYFIDYVMNNET